MSNLEIKIIFIKKENYKAGMMLWGNASILKVTHEERSVITACPFCLPIELAHLTLEYASLLYFQTSEVGRFKANSVYI